MAYDRSALPQTFAPVLLRRGYSHVQLAILWHIGDHEGSKPRTWGFASNRVLAIENGCTISYVQKTVRKARLDGFIEQKDSAGQNGTSKRRIVPRAFAALESDLRVLLPKRAAHDADAEL